MKYTNQDIENRLREETRNITPDVLLKAKYANLEELDYDNGIYKRKPLRLVMSFLTAFVLLFVMTNIIIYGQVYETITVDINPSVEFEVNRYGRVLNVNYNNNEAYDILKEVNMRNTKIEKALEISYDKLYDEGYLDNEENMIIVSGYTKSAGLSDKKLEKLVNIIKNKSDQKQVSVIVEANKVTKEDRQEAKENNVSLGKLKLINMILEETDLYSFDDLKDMNMKDLRAIYLNFRRGKGN
ncbi:MAG: hypothetical protein WC008_06290 [Bacilli bacterium]